jgi:hypothetical protein
LERDWLNLNFQMINKSRQTLSEVQNCSVYKVGNNILSNRLSCTNKKLQLDFLNLPFEIFKIKCMSPFLLWSVLTLFFWLFLLVIRCSYCNLTNYTNNGTLGFFSKQNNRLIRKHDETIQKNRSLRDKIIFCSFRKSFFGKNILVRFTKIAQN